MWSFRESELSGDWMVTNGDKSFHVQTREEAIELSGTLNNYFLNTLVH